MYVTYWNLRESPFQNVADTRYAYLSNQHREGLARLLYLVDGRKLGGVLVGPYGVGKSMILELIAEKVQEQGTSRFVHIDATPAGTLGVAQQILNFLGKREAISDISNAMVALQTVLNADEERDTHLVLAIDEAQFLREESAFEFFHLLTNLRHPRRREAANGAAITLILSGHSDLLARVRSEASFCQRMQLAWELEPLDANQTVEYIQHRMRAAGGDLWVFEEAALDEVYRMSGGVPRQVNNICDIALLLGYSSNAEKIGLELIKQASEEVYSALSPDEQREEVGV